jgi:uncharacterized protein DUF5134
MNLVMIAMVWAVAVPDPMGLLLVTLGAATVWFALQATGVPLRKASLVPALLPASLPPESNPVSTAAVCPNAHVHGDPSRPQCIHHAVLLAAMVWTLVALRPAPAATAGAAMPGMPILAPSATVAGAIGVYCLLAALAWATVVWWPGARARALRERFAPGITRARHARGRGAIVMSHVGMATAMGVMLMAMR